VNKKASDYIPPATPGVSTPSPNQAILPVSACVNREDHLVIGGCDTLDLATRFGTPLFVVDEATFRRSCQQLRDALAQNYPGESRVLYASKAWSCKALVALACSEQIGIEVVGGGELYTSLSAGADGAGIYFHGNNKTPSELRQAVACNAVVVAESFDELELLRDIARNGPKGCRPRVMLRLTPGIECHTHEYIQTGNLDSKFGFDPSEFDQLFRELAGDKSLDVVGIHAHIGSQIFELQAHRDLTGIMTGLFARALKAGLPLRELNLGGGLGMKYTEEDTPPSFAEWARVMGSGVAKSCQELNIPLPKLLCEPGRALVGPTTVTLYTCGTRKEVPGIRTYLAVDGGMSDNPRPITYGARYTAIPAGKMSQPMTQRYTIAGKHCESGDFLIKDAQLPPMSPGDVLAIPGTGAYNYSMASNYNRQPRPAVVLVCEGQGSIIIERETHDQLTRHDRVPDYLAKGVPARP
jgi:diaminopimelate decarboxylase